MFLILHLGRPDVLPVDDFGLRRGYQIAFRHAGAADAAAGRGAG